MLLVSDIDTVKSNERYIFNENVSKISEWMIDGNLFMISSNRDATRLSKQLKYLDIPVDYISCANGSYLFDRNWNIISKKTFNPSIMKEIKVFKNSQSVKNIQYGTTWNYENNEIGLREISSIHMEINKGFVDTKFLDNWKHFRKSHDYLYYIYYHNNHLYYVIKPKDSSKVDNIRYLEKFLPVLKNDIYVDAKGVDKYEEIRDYNSFIIGNEHCSDEYFQNYLSLAEVVDSISKEKVITKRKNNIHR